ncbi:MAG: ferritin-like domain-containing protein [Anaerolineales bacterium]|nr:ferritin-like domain-containing protein [Anaerolineales bacterium]
MTKELTLQDMYVEHLKDMYSAENQITKALPKIIKTVTSSELKRALEKHLKETEDQIARIEQVFQSLDASPRGKKCAGMEGLLEEGKEAMAEEYASPDLLDSSLIGGCQKVEHYEICGYKDLIHMAELLGDNKAVDLLTRSLQEEEAADQKLAALGENMITSESVHAGQAM